MRYTRGRGRRGQLWVATVLALTFTVAAGSFASLSADHQELLEATPTHSSVVILTLNAHDDEPELVLPVGDAVPFEATSSPPTASVARFDIMPLPRPPSTSPMTPTVDEPPSAPAERPQTRPD
jgi:hypothetical protein